MGDFENLSPRVDLEIFAPLGDFENLSPRLDLEIFAPLEDFENLSPRVDLEIFTGCQIRASINEDLKVSRNKFSDRSLINNYRELESVHH
ncbi:hypothetical protein V1477_008902 [Vespula maculifrons]|uniref:Uncharacterized protein n=1 Tax=Vespula maculifrons TaxID=7453 RepID=A0ABD2CED5_VESMC